MSPSHKPIPDPLQQENECKMQEEEMIPGSQGKIPAMTGSSLSYLRHNRLFSAFKFIHLTTCTATARAQEASTPHLDDTEAYSKLFTEASREGI